MSLLDIFLKDSICYDRDTCLSMFTGALFKISRKKLPKMHTFTDQKSLYGVTLYREIMPLPHGIGYQKKSVFIGMIIWMAYISLATCNCISGDPREGTRLKRKLPFGGQFTEVRLFLHHFKPT